MPDITPTVGRRIWYWPEGAECANSEDDKQPFDAGVILTHDDPKLVCLDVCDHHGRHHLKRMVTIEDEATPGCAQWMPYQSKKAAEDANPPGTKLL